MPDLSGLRALAETRRMYGLNVIVDPETILALLDENEALRVALAELLRLGAPLGHAARPIAPKDRPVVEAANRERFRDERARSLSCWDCNEFSDCSRGDGLTFGERDHALHVAVAVAREVLARASDPGNKT